MTQTSVGRTAAQKGVATTPGRLAKRAGRIVKLSAVDQLPDDDLSEWRGVRAFAGSPAVTQRLNTAACITARPTTSRDFFFAVPVALVRAPGSPFSSRTDGRSGSDLLSRGGGTAGGQRGEAQSLGRQEQTTDSQATPSG
jgi:hypothetical protein